MKVLHISTSDRQGGAAIAAYRLNEALQNEGVDSKMLIYNKIRQYVMFSYGFYLVFTIFVRNLYGIANAFKTV